jgi:hypothetical protein
MIDIKELKRWLNTLGPDDCIYIDEGGLALCSANDLKACIEIGGEPEGGYGHTPEDWCRGT